VYHPPPPGKGKNAKRTEVDGDVPAEQGTAASVVVDGQVLTPSLESTSIVDGAP